MTRMPPGPWPAASPRHCGTPPTRPRRNWRTRRGPSRCSARTPISPAPLSTGCRRRCASASADRACATATCSPSRRPAPSAWPSPTTPPMASSRPSPGATPAASAPRTAACRTTPSRITPGAAIASRAAMSTTCHRTGSPRWRSPHWTTCRCWRRYSPISTPASPRPSTCRPTIRSRPSRTSISRPGATASRDSPPTAPTSSPARCWRPPTPRPSRAGAARRISMFPTPTVGSGWSRCRNPPSPRCAGAGGHARPAATRPGATWSTTRMAPSPSSSAIWTMLPGVPPNAESPCQRACRKMDSASPSKSGSTVRSSRAAWARWPSRCPWTCAPTIAAG